MNSQPIETTRDYSVTEACMRLNVTPPTIYKLLASGQLKGYKVGRTRRITSESIELLRSGNQATA